MAIPPSATPLSPVIGVDTVSGFSPDSQTLAVGGVDEWPNAAIWTYAVNSWQPGMKLAEFWNIPDVAYSPDGGVLVGGGTSRNVRVWRTSDGTEAFILYHAGQVSSLAISPNGSTAAMGLCEVSDSQTSQCTLGAVWAWDLSTGRLIRELSDFSARVEAVTFSRDGSLVIAGSQDGTLRAYASSDFRLLLTTASPPGGSPAGILALDLSPDGRIVVTGGVGNIHLWRVEP
jgi:WD40 repeat protein